MVTLLVAAYAVQAPPIVQVTPASFTDARAPYVAVADGRVYVAFGMGDTIYLSTSLDEGKSFGEPVKVASPSKTPLGMRRGPRVAVHRGVVTITVIGGPLGGGKDGDVLAYRSSDSGRSWTGPVKVNGVEGSAREGLHAMAIGPDGKLACTWLDLREKGTTLYLSTSKDGGATWSANRLVYASPSGTICECCHPSLAFSSTGKLYVMFRNWLDGARDMYLASSADGGATFGPAVKLGEGTWPLRACPMDGGMLAIGRDGSVKTFWRREGTMYASGAAGAEKRIADGLNGWMACASDGDYYLWQDRRKLLIRTPQVEQTELSPRSSDPVIEVSPDGKLVFAAWWEGGSIRGARFGAAAGQQRVDP